MQYVVHTSIYERTDSQHIIHPSVPTHERNFWTFTDSHVRSELWSPHLHTAIDAMRNSLSQSASACAKCVPGLMNIDEPTIIATRTELTRGFLLSHYFLVIRTHSFYYWICFKTKTFRETLLASKWVYNNFISEKVFVIIQNDYVESRIVGVTLYEDDVVYSWLLIERLNRF